LDLLYPGYIWEDLSAKEEDPVCEDFEEIGEFICLGYYDENSDGLEYDCLYPFASQNSCENCIANGGCFDPRINNDN
jgi:hypothetical protein